MARSRKAQPPTEIFVGILDGNYNKYVGRGNTLTDCMLALKSIVDDEGDQGEDITDAEFFRATKIEVEIETVIRERAVSIKEVK